MHETDNYNYCQIITSYIVSWFFWFYFIMSADEIFPKESEVVDALKEAATKERDEALSPESEAILDKCGKYFWFQPATTLRGMMPGILDDWDASYLKHIPDYEDTKFCDVKDPVWRASWNAYAESLISQLSTLSSASTYIKLPKRATSRLRYFLFKMMALHNTSIFPTKSFIKDLAETFERSKEAFCDVSESYTSFSTTSTMKNEGAILAKGVPRLPCHSDWDAYYYLPGTWHDAGGNPPRRITAQVRGVTWAVIPRGELPPRYMA